MIPKPKRKTKRKVKIKSAHKELEDKCDVLWSNIIKMRAGFKSEISERTAPSILNAHHLLLKPNYRLRFELENGICCTSGEHKFGFHHQDEIIRKKFTDKVKELRGQDIYERLNMLKRQHAKTDLSAVYLYLKEEEKKYNGR